MDNYYDKLKALLEGLEIEHIEHLLANGDVETYKILGEMIAQKCKWSKNDQLAIVFECNYEQNDLDIEIVIYGSGLDVHLDDEDILITTFDTKEGFIQAIQLACIKYLELKNG